MKLIKNTKVTEHSIYSNPPMFCFGGFNPSIEIEAIVTGKQIGRAHV